MNNFNWINNNISYFDKINFTRLAKFVYEFNRTATCYVNLHSNWMNIPAHQHLPVGSCTLWREIHPIFGTVILIIHYFAQSEICNFYFPAHWHAVQSISCRQTDNSITRR